MTDKATRQEATFKRCPYCRGIAELYDSKDHGANAGICHGVYVRCTECGAYGKTAIYEWAGHNEYGYETLTLTRQEARIIAAIEWNARSHRQYKNGQRRIIELLRVNRAKSE